MAVKSTLAFGLQESIGKLWKHDDLSDFTVVVEGTSFQCHRFILSACSSFFQAMFRSNMKECQENWTEIGEIKSNTFEIILNSLYRGIDGLTEGVVLEVWSASVQLQIGYMINECESFVKRNMSVHNCFSVLRHAKFLSSQDVIQFTLDFIARNFQQVMNMESLLQLSFRNFFQVVKSDNLTVTSENSVVEKIIKWVEYKEITQNEDTNSEVIMNNVDTVNEQIMSSQENTSLEKSVCPSMDNLENNAGTSEINAENNTGPSEINAENNTGTSEINLENNAGTSKINAENNTGTSKIKENEEQSTTAALPEKNDQENSLSVGLGNSGESNKTERSGGNETSSCTVVVVKKDRRKYLYKLISQCRVCLMSPSYLQKLLKSNELIFSDRETHNALFNSLMYLQCVELRHECWPEEAVHRLNSDLRHAMVYVSNRKLHAYDLISGAILEYVDLPENLPDPVVITAFDNVLLVCSSLQNTKGNLYMYSRDQKWSPVGDTFTHCNRLLPHGSHLYSYNGLTDHYVSRCNIMQGYSQDWSPVLQVNSCYLLMRFHDYILVFYAENNNVFALSYNTVNGIYITNIGPLHGAPWSMISFTQQDFVYILQGNGSLWMIISTETDPVEFQFITQLWDVEWTLHGAVVYKGKLFVFCAENEAVKPELCQAACPGIFEGIEIVQLTCQTQCLPMVIQKF